MTLAERCSLIDLLIVDVDGVLTDGGIVYGSGGLEVKEFNVRDGYGLKRWLLLGKRAAIITGRSSPIVEARARELGIQFVHQGALDKMPAYRQVLSEAQVAPEAVCYVGDDLPDLAPQRNCGLAVAVADAVAELRHEAHYVTQAAGGRGAVREAIELVLRCQGQW